MASLVNSTYQTFKQDLITIILNLFQIIEEEAIISNTLTLIPKSGKDNTQKRKLYTNIFEEYRCKNLKQNTSKLNTTIHLKNTTQSSGFIPGTQGCQHKQIGQCNAAC